MRMFPISERFVVLGVPWVCKFVISTVSLHPKIGNIRRFVPCGCSLYPKDSLYRGFPGSVDLLFTQFPYIPGLETSEGLYLAGAPYHRGIRCIGVSLFPEIRCIQMLAKSGPSIFRGLGFHCNDVQCV